MFDEERALLAAIRMHPAEDLPRLVYADWLQEHGRDERAEFIREAVAYPHCEFVRLTGGNPFQLLGIPEPSKGRVMGPESGSPVVDAVNSRTWMWGESEDLGCVIHDLVRGFDYRVDRGFVHAVRASAADWLHHADEILELHAVTKVILTTQITSTGRINDFAMWSDLARTTPWNEGWRSHRWPNITFTLPT